MARGQERPRPAFNSAPAAKRTPLTVLDLQQGAVYELDKPPFGPVVAIHAASWSFLTLRPDGHEIYLVHEDGTVEQIMGDGTLNFLTLNDFSPTGEVLPVEAGEQRRRT